VHARVQRLKHVFSINIETCPACGGAVRIIACIKDPQVIEKIRTHLDRKRPAAAPNRLPRCRAPPPPSLSGRHRGNLPCHLRLQLPRRTRQEVLWPEGRNRGSIGRSSTRNDGERPSLITDPIKIQSSEVLHARGSAEIGCAHCPGGLLCFLI